LTVLMEDLLALGRPVREEKKEDVGIVALAQKALAIWRQSALQIHEALFMDSEKAYGECLVHVDSAKIEQAIFNLLDNAQQHSNTGDPICMSVETRGPATVRISVRDSGPGIQKEILPQIFEPFFTTRKSGTGLGLSIVRHIVESHGGTITAQNNTDGPGATFSIDLPLSKPPAPRGSS
jgi:signal transduction histidine kinase